MDVCSIGLKESVSGVVAIRGEEDTACVAVMAHTLDRVEVLIQHLTYNHRYRHASPIFTIT